MQVSLVHHHKGLRGSERSQESCRTAVPLALTPVGGALPAAIQLVLQLLRRSPPCLAEGLTAALCDLAAAV